jgi:protein-S-isoprenylcysteine O-methyltransferase Ste14
MTPNAAPEAAHPRLTRSGVSRIVTVFGSMLVSAALFFGAAGTLSLPRAWLYYGALLTYMLVALPVMLVRFPGAIEVVNERGKLAKPGVKAWDRAFVVAYAALLLAVHPLAGLDAGRFHWSEIPAPLAPPAVAVVILATVLGQWALIENRWAETGVRIQEDRRQQVVSSGPYAWVRHPLYVSSILTQLAYPIAVGSLWAFVPALAIVGLLVWRTSREDETLRTELPGYAAYASRVRHRLLPGVW